MGLFEQTADGTYFWEYVRFYVFYELQCRLGLADVPSFRPDKPVRRAAEALRTAAAGLLTRNPFWTSRKPLLFFGCPRATRAEDGVWWDTTVDPCLDALACPYYYIERYNGAATTRRRGCARFTTTISYPC